MMMPAIFNTTAVHGMEAVLTAFTLVAYLSRAVSLLVQFKEHQAASDPGSWSGWVFWERWQSSADWTTCSWWRSWFLRHRPGAAH